MPLVSPQTWKRSDLTAFGGILYSDPDRIPVEGGRFIATHSVASPIPLTRIGPLSRAEIAALSSEGSAHFEQSACVAGIEFRLPLEYIGGRYPFDYVVTGPAGIEVVYGGRSGGVPPFVDYIRIPNPTVGTHEITVLCIDQDDTVVDEIAFDLAVYDEDDTDHVGWVNPGHASASDSNDGSRASPWLTINGWYGGSLNASTHRNKIIYYEDVGPNAGTGIDIGGVSGVSYATNGSRCRLNDSKPKVHRFIGDFPVHGNGACWNFEGGTGWSFTGDAIHDDPQYVEAVTVPPENGYRMQWFRGGGASIKRGRIGMGYTLSGAGGPFAPAGGSNSSGYEFPDNSGTPVFGFSFPGLIVDGVVSTNERWAVIKNNNAHGVLCQGVVVRNCSNVIIFHHKGVDIADTEERGCVAIEGNTNCQFRVVQWILNPVQRVRNTWCWNNYDVATDLTADGGVQFVGDPADVFESQDGWCNNARVTNYRFGAVSGTSTLTRNVRIHSGEFTDGVEDGFGMTYSSVNEYKSTTAADLDATTNLLAGAARTAQLGLAGCEMVEA